jgi:hypothetical protein
MAGHVKEPPSLLLLLETSVLRGRNRAFKREEDEFNMPNPERQRAPGLECTLLN